MNVSKKEITGLTRALTRALASQGVTLGHQQSQHVLAALLQEENFHVLSKKLAALREPKSEAVTRTRVSAVPSASAIAHGFGAYTTDCLLGHEAEAWTLMNTKGLQAVYDKFGSEVWGPMEDFPDGVVADLIREAAISQDAALRKASPVEPRSALEVFILGEEIPTCPHCGSRTNFDMMPDGRQHHRCLNASCGFEFIGEDEEAACPSGEGREPDEGAGSTPAAAKPVTADSTGDNPDAGVIAMQRPCPACGAIGDFTDYESDTGREVHRCTNKACGKYFCGNPDDAWRELNFEFSVETGNQLDIPGRFNAVELQDTDETSEEGRRKFNLYVHLAEEGGVELLGQFSAFYCAEDGDNRARALARQYAQALATKYQWPVYDHLK